MSIPVTTFPKSLFINILEDYQTKFLTVALLKSSASILLDNLEDNTFGYNDILGHEVDNGGGYLTGGQRINNLLIDYDNLQLKGNNVEWLSSTITARYAIIYNSNEDDGYPVIAFIDFGEEKVSNNSLFEISWGDGGILKFTTS